MAKLHHVKRARKARPKHGIKRGAEYWWWWRRMKGQRSRGTKVYSATRPRPSAMLYGYAKECALIEEAAGDCSDPADAVDVLRELAERCDEMAVEFEDKFNNLPDSLQGSATGELLEARQAACERIAGELNDAADDLAGWEGDGSSEPEDVVAAAVGGIGWDWGE